MTDIKETISKIKSIDNLKTVIEHYGVKFISEPGGYKALCPLHSEKTPSFHIKSDNKGEAIWSCFGCGKSGDIINFIEDQENISNVEAIKKAYEILGLSLDLPLGSTDNGKLSRLKNKFKSYLPNGLDDSYSLNRLHLYVNKEGIPVIARPIYRSSDLSKKKEPRTYKIIDQNTWYQFGTTTQLGAYEVVPYNYPKVIKAINNNKSLYIVEGEKDADTLNRLGFTATTFQDKPKSEDIWNIYKKQLAGANIIFIGDTGEAGEKFKKLVWNNLKNTVKSFKVIDLPGLEALGDNADVTDWLESGHTKEELLKVVNSAKDIKWSIHWKDISIKENKNTGEKTTIPLKTIDNFKLILERANTNIYINQITKVMDVETDLFNNKTLDTLMIEIQSLCTKIGFKCNKTDVRDWIETIAHEKSINPFKVWLDNLPAWDKASRIDNYLSNFKTVEGYQDVLKELLMKKWLLSFVGSAYDPDYKAYGLLVLKGGQGIGKGECFKRLIPIKEDWVFLGEQEFKGDRDNMQILTSNLLVELSEFARSSKKVNELKGFVTMDKDKLSLKYDKYASTNKRNTIYFATVNDAEFLIDDENRRMWIIDLESINWEGINNFDYIQLWSEIKETYLASPIIDGQPCYHLTPAERELLQINNKNYEFRTELETLLEANLDFDGSKRLWLKSAEIVQLIDIKASGTAITRALKRLGEETGKDKCFNKVRGKFSTCPLPKNWYGEINPKYKDRLVTDTKIAEDVAVEKVKTDTELKSEIKKLKQMIKLLKQQMEEKNYIINQQQLKIVELENDNKTWEQYFKTIDKEA